MVQIRGDCLEKNSGNERVGKFPRKKALHTPRKIHSQLEQ